MTQFLSFKRMTIFAVLTDGDCIHFAEQAINLLKLRLSIFFAQSLGYWRLPLRRLLYALRGDTSSVSSVKSSRLLFDKVCSSSIIFKC